MSIFQWRNEPTRFFGIQPFPFARVTIEDARGRSRTFSLLVDSGAVVSLLSRSAAELLGIEIVSGQRITLTGVGQRENEVFVHRLIARIGGMPLFPTRFAISTSENVPNLLGRLDVLDRFRIEFDPTGRVTQIALP